MPESESVDSSLMALLKFHNELAVREISIGVHEFNCIGVLPPHDHPHIYLRMELSMAMSNVSSFTAGKLAHSRFDTRLKPGETNPPYCHFDDTD